MSEELTLSSFEPYFDTTYAVIDTILADDPRGVATPDVKLNTRSDAMPSSIASEDHSVLPTDAAKFLKT